MLMPLHTEPEGQDFWLQPGETVEIRAEVDSGSADFEIDEGPDGVTVAINRHGIHKHLVSRKVA